MFRPWIDKIKFNNTLFKDEDYSDKHNGYKHEYYWIIHDIESHLLKFNGKTADNKEETFITFKKEDDYSRMLKETYDIITNYETKHDVCAELTRFAFNQFYNNHLLFDGNKRMFMIYTRSINKYFDEKDLV